MKGRGRLFWRGRIVRMSESQEKSPPEKCAAFDPSSWLILMRLPWGTHTFGKRVSKGDLVLFYEASPRQWLQQVYTVAGVAPPEQQGRQGVSSTLRDNYEFRGDPIFGTPGYRHAHVLRRVCVLDPPLLVKQLETRSLSVVKEAIFSQRHNRRITEHWWLLH